MKMGRASARYGQVHEKIRRGLMKHLVKGLVFVLVALAINQAAQAIEDAAKKYIK